jgi:hypothetical protein
MADDRLDDAIDAVVRAVDRIERATRGTKPDGSVATADEPVSTGATGTVSAADLQPPPAKVSPGRDAWGESHGKKKHKHKHKHKKRPPELPPEAYEADPVVDEDEDFTEWESLAEPVAPLAPGLGLRAATAQPIAHASSAGPTHAPAEVHELVGRIVARSQELDEQLEAARTLRVEISDLVARLAAAATHQR